MRLQGSRENEGWFGMGSGIRISPSFWVSISGPSLVAVLDRETVAPSSAVSKEESPFPQPLINFREITLQGSVVFLGRSE